MVDKNVVTRLLVFHAPHLRRYAFVASPLVVSLYRRPALAPPQQHIIAMLFSVDFVCCHSRVFALRYCVADDLLLTLLAFFRSFLPILLLSSLVSFGYRLPAVLAQDDDDDSGGAATTIGGNASSCCSPCSALLYYVLFLSVFYLSYSFFRSPIGQ